MGANNSNSARVLQALKMVFLILVQLAFLSLDAVLLLGFTFFNGSHTTLLAHVGLLLMLLGDLSSIAVSWWKPRIGGICLVSVTLVSLILVLSGSTKGAIGSLWLTGAVFWGGKGILALYLTAQSPKPKISDSSSELRVAV